MNTIQLSTSLIHTVLWFLSLLLFDYVGVLLSILIDLRSGTINARRRGVPRTSGGYRRTVDKASRYFITLLALSVIDGVFMVVALLLRSTMGWSIPVLPLFTTIGAISLCLIEAKSVMENTQQKSDFTSAADSLSDLLDDKSLRRLIDALRHLKE